jgi:hypothetical protein
MQKSAFWVDKAMELRSKGEIDAFLGEQTARSKPKKVRLDDEPSANAPGLNLSTADADTLHRCHSYRTGQAHEIRTTRPVTTARIRHHVQREGVAGPLCKPAESCASLNMF